MPVARTDRGHLDFFCAVVIVGLLAGVAGLATTLVLRAVQHATYHYSFGTLLAGVAASSPIRRVVGPMIGAALAALGWWLLRRRTDVPPLAETIARRERVPRLSWSIDAMLQVLLVGSGASLGREGAPRQFAAALSDLGTGWLKRLAGRDREILLACAAGAGLGAVYAVPLAGALFSIRILLGTWQPRAVGAAFLSSGVAVAIGSAITRDQPNLQWPIEESTYLLTAHGLLLAPVAFAAGWVFNRLMAAARPPRPMRSWVLIPALAGAGLVMGVCSHWWPELPGNGRSILTVSLASGMTLVSALAILALKPLLTALFLRAGGTGGLLTPSLATGAAAGAALVLAINWASGTHLHVPAVSLAGAAGVLAVTQGSPIWAAIFVWELARPPLWLFALFLLTATAAHALKVLACGHGSTHAG
ncbi:chloride channel protein [Mycobacterium intracellulare]|uniref:Chloride channel protein n=1 Tax=Mycobacterium intracellulare TaxID=1767 RepID=A0AAE4RJU6_MYCIT|nr:chloride channel protein [Mycobacterium intracellulare]MCA2322223.1 chloride channel protein [Mycobacterium intracellulare]MCA2342745.1 chloride channel protein [Mycobacterium intracellulare]MDV6979921.1 chloride channel protein [Mycobacterium intracellulare]MDV6985477.1 chloride channel protein [Mycobacterium intracellulare]MDV7014301.1 chloride channel protein [Mycobacterium intracellulare]